jgi:hypothetical protein
MKKTVIQRVVDVCIDHYANELEVVNNPKKYHPQDVIRAKAVYSSIVSLILKINALEEIECRQISDAFNDGEEDYLNFK